MTLLDDAQAAALKPKKNALSRLLAEKPRRRAEIVEVLESEVDAKAVAAVLTKLGGPEISQSMVLRWRGERVAR